MSDENLLIDCVLNKEDDDLADGVQIEFDKQQMTDQKAITALKGIQHYLQTYDFIEAEEQREEQLDDIYLQELLDKQKDGSPEEVLEKWPE